MLHSAEHPALSGERSPAAMNENSFDRLGLPLVKAAFMLIQLLACKGITIDEIDIKFSVGGSQDASTEPTAMTEPIDTQPDFDALWGVFVLVDVDE